MKSIIRSDVFYPLHLGEGKGEVIQSPLVRKLQALAFQKWRSEDLPYFLNALTQSMHSREKEKRRLMPYCPKCKTEYNAGVKECSDCNALLVEKLPEEPKEVLEPIKYKLLRNLPSRLYAEMLKESLQNSGISAIIKGDDIGIMLGSYSTTSPVEISLWVPEEEWEKANQIADGMLDHI